MAETSIEFVDSAASFEEASMGILVNELPGFCIKQRDAKTIGYKAMAEIIDGVTDDLYGIDLELRTFTPAHPYKGNKKFGGGTVTKRRELQVGAHVDRGRVGLSLHLNKFGKGAVRMATSELSVVERVEMELDGGSRGRKYQSKTIEELGHFSGAIATTGLENGLWSVISVGNVPGLMPTIHDYQRNGPCSIRIAAVKLKGAQGRDPEDVLSAVDLDRQINL